MKVGIIDLKTGNIYSLYSRIKENLGIKCSIINNKEDIKNCDKIIFPGQGNNKCLNLNIKKIDFLYELKKYIKKKDFLGICLGKQMMFKFNEESKNNGFCIFNKDITKFNKDKNFRIPFIGWNKVNIIKKNNITKNIKNKSLFYFSHSYKTSICKNTTAYSYHNCKFSSIFVKKNITLLQFHPEMSYNNGFRIIRNFIG